MRTLLLSLCTAALLLVPAGAGATVLLNMSVEELTNRSSVIVEGYVLRQQVVEAEGRLWTDSYLKVQRSHKGGAAAEQVLRLRQPGGETPTIGMRVAGAARFKVGEQVLVFARQVGERHYVPVGMCLGKFTLVKDDKQVVRAVRDFTGAAIGTFDENGGFSIKPELSKPKARPLDNLLGEVRGHIKKASARDRKGGAR